MRGIATRRRECSRQVQGQKIVKCGEKHRRTLNYIEISLHLCALGESLGEIP
jgi:hypothetical protein